MPWKTNEDGNLTLINGDPVWVDGGGQESPIGPKHFQSAAEARREAAERRQRIEELESEIEAAKKEWDGLDSKEARQAIAELERLKKAQKRAKSAGEEGDEDLAARVAELEQELESERTRLETLGKEREQATQELESLRKQQERAAKESWLRGSKYFAPKDGQDAPLSYLTPKLAAPIVGPYLTVDDHGQVYGVWPEGHPKAGKKILNPDGEVARGDEITAAIFESNEDLRGSLRKQDASGAGSNAGSQNSSDTGPRHKVRLSDMTDQQKAEYIEKHDLSPDQFGQELEAEQARS